MEKIHTLRESSTDLWSMSICICCSGTWFVSSRDDVKITGVSWEEQLRGDEWLLGERTDEGEKIDVDEALSSTGFWVEFSLFTDFVTIMADWIIWHICWFSSSSFSSSETIIIKYFSLIKTN